MNQINYNAVFEKTLQRLNGTKPTLLLHVCCAPCLSFCLLRLLESFDITLFFCNDNITDENEFNKRLAEVRRLTDIINNGLYDIKPYVPLKLIETQLNPNAFFTATAGLQQQKEGGKRCRNCFNLRLGAAASFAKAKGFDFFGTTLTLSRHKNSRVINETGADLEKEYGVSFLFADFKKNYGCDQSIILCKKYGIYRQSFCGCPFSTDDENY